MRRGNVCGAVAMAVVVATLLLGGRARAIDNGLARTPPMGWNSWNRFGGSIDEKLIRETIDAMASNGMKDAGYVYVNIDDCWSKKDGRDEKGNLVPEPKRFAGGIKVLADYAHSKGLKLGIYSDAGTMTCAKFPGSKDHEEQDAKLWAEWGIDYLKYDWCNTKGQKQQEAYKTMSDALAKSGRPMVFSLCEWGSSRPWEWGKPVGNLWRTTGDIGASWGSVTSLLDKQVGLEAYAGPGGWNDPDMLEVGNGKLTADENRAHFGLWCLLAAPLLCGNDLRNMKPEVLEIITNKEAIAVNQDELGIQGAKVTDTGDLEVWAKPLKGGAQAIILFNRGAQAAKITASFVDLGWKADTAAALRDLWAHKDLPEATGSYAAEVPSHGIVMVKATPVKAADGNMAPTVRIVAGDSSATTTVPAGGKWTIRALPYDGDGRVVKVEIFEDGKSIKTFTGGPYVVSPGKPVGTYKYTASVTDDKGATATSAELVLTVEKAAETRPATAAGKP